MGKKKEKIEHKLGPGSYELVSKYEFEYKINPPEKKRKPLSEKKQRVKNLLDLITKRNKKK
ncbi:MAG: hypothetical protein KKH98_13060 [Spirochaetes bacterium]|nr:hypothetical protein [Spirochaetota bacterium]